jgi:hypothetical protein
VKTIKDILDAPNAQSLHINQADTSGRMPFRLRRVSFQGEGLQPEFRDVPWRRLRDAAYPDRAA